MFAEDDFLPLSGLQHLLFCERQAALIHLERIWVDNPLTVEGTHLHERADGGESESRGDLRVVRGLPLRCARLGLTGKADVVELRRLGPGEEAAGASLPGLSGLWRPFPVEYKRGRPKAHRADEAQLCAQALCLEEMLGVEIPAGALFYGQPRRRMEVELDRALRQLTEEAAARFHELVDRRITPKPVREPKCDQCSLLDVCLPAAPASSAQRYLARYLRQVADSPEGEEKETSSP
ncbi:MAG TPA: CRISPR-associated protein Cas4 [Thermoanaerobaculia bacterium]|jgi:CRISPR-associated exonuclease Cas4